MWLRLKIEKDVFFRFVTSLGQRKKNGSPHEESHLRPSDSALRCSTTEPQRLHVERGLLRSSYDPFVFVDCLPTHENVIDVPFFNSEVRHTFYLLSFFISYLSGNKIRYLPQGIFKGLKQLLIVLVECEIHFVLNLIKVVSQYLLIIALISLRSTHQCTKMIS